MGATGIRTGITIGTATDAEGSHRARPVRLVALGRFAKRDVRKQTVNDASQVGRTGTRALVNRDLIG